MALTRDQATTQTFPGHSMVLKTWDLQQILQSAVSAASVLASCFNDENDKDLHDQVHSISKNLKRAVSSTSAIMDLTHGRMSDIIEVSFRFSDGDDRDLLIQVVQYPSTEATESSFPAVDNEPGLLNLFNIPESDSLRSSFEIHNPIFFCSSSVTIKQANDFMDLLTAAERSMIETLAFDRSTFDEMKKTSLRQFTSLETLILVSEIPNLEFSGPSEQLRFELMPPTAPGNTTSPNAEDVRAKAQKELDHIRKQYGIWPAGGIRVYMAWVERNGKLTVTDLPSKTYSDLEKEKREKEYPWADNILDEDESIYETDDMDDMAGAEGESDGGEIRGADEKGKEVALVHEDLPKVASENIPKIMDESDDIIDQFGALGMGCDDGEVVDEDTLAQIAESNRKWEERKKATQIDKRLEESDNGF